MKGRFQDSNLAPEASSHGSGKQINLVLNVLLQGNMQVGVKINHFSGDYLN